MKKALSVLTFLFFTVTSWATVSIDTNRVQYSCDGSETTYTYAFQIYEDDDLVVIKSDATSLTETVLVLNTDYTVTGAGDAEGGTVELTAGSTCASGCNLTITRAIDTLQSIDLVDGEAFSAETLETGYDKAILIAQDQNEKFDRALLLKKSSDLNGLEFPDPSSNASLCWNNSGTGIINCPTITSVSTVIGDDQCFPDYAELDQGVAGSTIKSCVDSIVAGTGVICLRHNSGSSTTTYTLTTSETIPSNVTLKIEPGAIIAIASGVTLAFADGAHLVAGNGPCFDGDGNVSGLANVFSEMWGAKGDGTTDDSSAFESAISSLGTNGGFLNLLKKTYKTNFTVSNDLTVMGVSENGSKLIPAIDDAVIKTALDASTVRLNFENFTIDGSATKTSFTSQDGIRLGTTTASTFVDSVCIKNVRVTDCGRYGIYAFGTSAAGPFVQKQHYEDVTSINNTLAGVYFHGLVIESVLTNCKITSNGDSSNQNAIFGINGSVNPQRITLVGGIYNPKSYATDTGVFLSHVAQFTAIGVDFEEAKYMVHMNGALNRNISFIGCNFSSSNDVTYGIWAQDSDGFIVQNCAFSSGGTMTAGIYNNSGINRLTGSNISSNYFSANVTTPVNFLDYVTIASGVINKYLPFQRVETESAAATDDLVNIYDSFGSTNNLVSGETITINPLNGSHTVVVKHGTGNILCYSGADITLDETYKSITLTWSASRSSWVCDK